MRTLRTLMTAVALLGTMAACATAERVEMANLVPANAKLLVETVDAAGLRQLLTESKFWAALEETEAFCRWRASERHAEAEKRIDLLLAELEMDRDEALKTYLGGRSALVILPSGQEKPYGVFLTETTNEMAQKLAEAVGGQQVGRHQDVAIWEVVKDNRVDRMAWAGGVLMISGTRADELEQVLDVVVGGGGSLGAGGDFFKATEGLPAGWRARVYAAEAKPRQSPGAVAMYPQGDSRVHFEWQIVSGPEDISLTRPTVLTGPKALPETAVAAVASAFYPGAIWEKAQAKVADQPDGPEKIRKAEMFIRGWFPGHSMESITGGFGPEAAAALVKGDAGGAPGLVGLVRLKPSGVPVAHAFKNGLAAKAMILGALGQNQEDPEKRINLNVREEAYGDASLLIIEAPQALEKVLGNWANDIGLTVAVTNDWLIVGTTPAGVKKTIDTAAGGGPSLAADLTQAGEKVPAEPATRWGVIQPASGADIVLAWAEKLAGKERVEKAKKAVNLAELMKLVKRMIWQRTDEPQVIRGTADIQAIE
ncbi:MAG: hypothetical protein AMK72_11000 [Planctomycetes bacterium SM23_25]|nr:MAG: hypothetical protein AMK72_11000 [Planctomycetes bacterium SM23_25]